jgi:hypothetical protein
MNENNHNYFHNNSNHHSKPTNIIKENEVIKQGGKIKTWKKRLCILTDNLLLYYKIANNEATKYNNLQGQIEINSIINVESVNESRKRKFCFKIYTPSRNFLMCAKDEKDMLDWIQKINYLRQQKNILEDKKDIISSIANECREPDIDFSNKNVDELEQLLNNIDEKMKLEIHKFLDICNQEKNEIIDILMQKEMEELKNKYSKEINEIEIELQSRKI